MSELPLKLDKGYLYMRVGADWYLIDTGTFSSFSERGEVTIDGLRFELPLKEIRGMDAKILADHVKVPVNGLLGNDVLDHFDHIWDLPNGVVKIGPPGSLVHGGSTVDLKRTAERVAAALPSREGEVRPTRVQRECGLMLVGVKVEEAHYPMLFDTGAAISYFDYPNRERFPSAGDYTDFYPNVGPFTTDTRWVPATLGDTTFTLRCGSLTPVFGEMIGNNGIVGNEILKGRAVGYFPERGQMVLGAIAHPVSA